MDKINTKPTKAAPWNHTIMYRGALCVVYLHLALIYSIYLLTSAKITTILFNLIIYILAGIGVTAGAHRLWSHKAYKAKLPLQIILMLFQSMSFQFSVITWVKMHRLHHKYSDTDADPHNASRGFFFSHMGWMMVYAHDEVQKCMKEIDISDVTSNSILKFQKNIVIASDMSQKILPLCISTVEIQPSDTEPWLITNKKPYAMLIHHLNPLFSTEAKTFLPLTLLKNLFSKYAYLLIGTMCFLLPTIIPMIFWSETFNIALHINILRYILNLHATMLVNSAAHMFGNKPYDINIMATQNNFIAVVACGEGFHNYHHTFPWDYRTAELGNNFLNLCTHFIDLCAYFGWAYDLKTADNKIVRARAIRTGDGSDCWGKVKTIE